MPLISIIVPTRNRPQLLQRALASIQQQTFSDFEAIIVNDAGQDVQNIVDQFNDPRFVYTATETQTRLPGVRNVGIKASKGTYIAYLDDDDLYYPHHLQRAVDIFEQGSQNFVYTGCVTVYEDQNKEEKKRIYRQYAPYHPSLIRHQSFMPACSILHHKKIFEQAGYFDESITFAEDWDLWYRFSRVTDFYHIDEYTCEYRKQSGIGSNINSLQKTIDNRAYLDQIRVDKYGIITNARSHFNGKVPSFVIDKLVTFLGDKKIYLYGAGSYFEQIYPYLKQNIRGIYDARYTTDDESYNGIPCLPLEKLRDADSYILSTVVGQINDVLLTASQYTSTVDNFLFLDDFFDQCSPVELIHSMER